LMRLPALPWAPVRALPWAPVRALPWAPVRALPWAPVRALPWAELQPPFLSGHSSCCQFAAQRRCSPLREWRNQTFRCRATCCSRQLFVRQWSFG
jgi:hypothetical protein